MYNKLLHWRFY